MGDESEIRQSLQQDSIRARRGEQTQLQGDSICLMNDDSKRLTGDLSNQSSGPSVPDSRLSVEPAADDQPVWPERNPRHDRLMVQGLGAITTGCMP
jgi:hypothetical protein